MSEAHRAAFPLIPTNLGGQWAEQEFGLTKREYAAIELHKALLIQKMTPCLDQRAQMAGDAIAHADALLAALSQ